MNESASVAQTGASAFDGDSFERWARTRSIRRDFWLVTGIFVGGEGAIGFVSILFSGFPGGVELARTFLSGLLCSWTAAAGFALVTRHWLPRYARVTIVAAGVGFPLLVAFIWVSGSGAWSNLHWSAVAVLIGALAVSAQRLWLGAWEESVAKRIVFGVTAVSIAVVVSVTVTSIWNGLSSGSGAGRALSAFSFLTLVGFVLTPILRRAHRTRGAVTTKP
jgi:hypothetical protein